MQGDIKKELSFNQILKRLKKEDIPYDEFLELLKRCKDRFFQNPDLEFELLLSNGFPLDFQENSICLKTRINSIKDQTFCVVDIETNGSLVNKGHQIIELGAVKYRNSKIIDSFSQLVHASNIPEYIQDVTNISLDMLEYAPHQEKVLQDFKLFLEDDVFVAHDIKFDYNFISNSMKKYSLGELKNRKLCTIDLAKRTIVSEKYGLSSLTETLGIEVDSFHRAYDDALATTKVLEKAFLNLPVDINTTEELIAFSKSDNIIKQERRKSDV